MKQVSVSGGGEFRERAGVADREAAAAEGDDAGLPPLAKLLGYRLPRDAQHAGEIVLREPERRGCITCGGEQAAALSISQGELASMLGVSRELVSRQLVDWSEAGIIFQGRGRLVVQNRGALERIVGATG